MRLLNFCIYAYAILIFAHGMGTNLSFLEILGGASIFLLSYFLNKEYFFYFVIGAFVVLFSIFYGYRVAQSLSFFAIVMCAISFFLLIAIFIEVMSIYKK